MFKKKEILFFAIILLSIAFINSQPLTRTSNSETNIVNNKLVTTIYPDNIFINVDDKFLTLDQYLNYSIDSDGMTWQTTDGHSLRFNFNKADIETYDSLKSQQTLSLGKTSNQVSLINQEVQNTKLAPSFSANIINNKDSMIYDISNDAQTSDYFLMGIESDDEITYTDNGLIWNNIIFDFSDAVNKQNLNVAIDSNNNEISISGENISMIDPTVIYNSTGTGTKTKNCDPSGFCSYNSGGFLIGGSSGTPYSQYIYFNMTDLENKSYSLINAFINWTHNGAGNAIIIPVHKVNSYWNLTDNSIPTYSVNYTSYTSGTNGYDLVNVTKIVNEFFNGSSKDFGFFFNGTVNNAFTNTQYYDFSTTSVNRPTLILTYSSMPNVTTVSPIGNYTNGTQYFVCNESDLVGLKNVSVNVFNGISMVYNATVITGSNNFTNLSLNLADNSYNWSCTVYNQDNISFTSLNKSFLIDSTPPTISIISPSQNTQYSVTTIQFNSTVTDINGLTNCWWQNNSGTNFSISCNQNSTFVQSEGNKKLNFWANDTFGNIANKTISYQINLTSPAVNLLNPTLNQWFTNGLNLVFNFTVQDPQSNGIKNCSLYGNWTGTWSINQSNTTSATTGNLLTYNFKQNFTDGQYLWNTQCWNLGGTLSSFALSNYTFGVDSIYPQAKNISVVTTQGTNVIQINTSSSDTNLNYCWYSIFNSANGLDSLTPENTSIGCNTIKNWSVSGYDTYTIKFYVNDSAGNTNSSNYTFTTSQTPTTTISSGGVGFLPSNFYQSILTTNFSILTDNNQNLLDIVLAKDSVTPRTKNIFLVNKAVEPITLQIRCDTENVNQSSRNISICDYVKFVNDTITLSPNELANNIISVSILTPPNSSINDVYFFNILAENVIDNNTIYYAKLSVQARVTILGTIFYKSSYLPFQSSTANDAKIHYPVVWISIAFAFLIFAIIFGIFAYFKLSMSGFLLGTLGFIGSFIAFSLLL